MVPSQSITISGLGSSQFKRAVKAIETIHRFLLSKYSELLPWKPDTYDLWSALSFENRLVTPRAAAPKGVKPLPFGNIDPRRVLSKTLSSLGVYTPDNQVVYQRLDKE